jgi:hypothetical protein
MEARAVRALSAADDCFHLQPQALQDRMEIEKGLAKMNSRAAVIRSSFGPIREDFAESGNAHTADSFEPRHSPARKLDA